MPVICELKIGKDKLCILETVGYTFVELLVKTRRRQSPYDQWVIGRINENGKYAPSRSRSPWIATLKKEAAPYMKELLRLYLVARVLSE